MPSHSSSSRRRALPRIPSWLLALAWIAAIVGSGSPAHASRREFGMKVTYSALYESNIYHSFVDSNQSKAMVNALTVRGIWRKQQSRRVLHRAHLDFDLDQYMRNANRNQVSAGVTYEPRIRYAQHGHFVLSLELGRRQKDLIDDSGQSLARTLTRWETDAMLLHRYDLGPVRLEQHVGYENLDYDERDTLIVNSTGTTEAHLTSYDYHGVTAGFRISYDLSSRTEIQATFDTEKRNYDERRTYTVEYGATLGRPFAIRSFHENAVGLRVGYRFYKNSEIRGDVDYTRRTDNFENYYGYEHRQYKISLKLAWAPSQDTDISFRFKNKDYPNYHTRNIGSRGRVHIDYADVQLEHSYPLTTNITVNGYLRNYNKVSNDPTFDYHDLTAGIGFHINY